LFSGSNGSRLNRWLTVIGKRMLRPIRGGVIDIPLMALCPCPIRDRAGSLRVCMAHRMSDR
jgi:hypothetical protein